MNNKKLKKVFSELSTPLITDACMRLGVFMRVAPIVIQPLVAGWKVAGWEVTGCRLESCRLGPATYNLKP